MFPHADFCQVSVTLLNHWNFECRRYAKCVGALRPLNPGTAEIEAALGKCEDARLRTETARKVLEEHRAKHGCDRHGQEAPPARGVVENSAFHAEGRH